MAKDAATDWRLLATRGWAAWSGKGSDNDDDDDDVEWNINWISINVTIDA